MTMRLDIVTNDAGELVRREHARELGAGVVIAIYRLVKLAQMHDLGNQAFVRQLEQTHQMVGEYCLRAGTNVNILFAHKAVFVAGQLLKGSRSTYEAASELGEIFERLGGSEVFIQRDISREELLAFAEQISVAFRTGGQFQFNSPKIRLRRVADAARLRGLELENLTADQRIVRTYASAVVIMRRFFEDLAASKYILPRRIKRIAQSLVDLSEGSTPSFLGVTEVRNANFDEAGRAVNTAILAVTMAREVTQERTILAQIAMAGMMHDVARPRALALASSSGPAMPGMAGPTTLSEDQEDRLAAGAAAVLTALGRVNEPSITRTVLTFEALWLRRQTWLGPVYWGLRAPTLHAKIIAVSRRYNDLLTPEPGLAPPTPDFAVAQLSEELKEPQDRVVLRMLVSSLGLLPMGTVVQLSTGEMAEVIRGPKGPGEKPRVKIVMDGSGGVVDPPAELELAHDPRRTVARVVSVDGWRKGLETRGGVVVGGYDPDAQASDVPPPPPAMAVHPPPGGHPASKGFGSQPAPVLPPLSPLAPVPIPRSGGSGTQPPARAATSAPPRSIAEQYADQFAAWGEPEAPRRDSTSGSGSVQSGEHNSSASLPSMGSSPSAVAEAMGRMINDSLRPPAAIPREGADRTVVQQQADGEPAERMTARPGKHQREPTARGNLAATPLPHVLVYMLDHSLTGSVVFEGPTGDDTIVFSFGVPTKIRTQDPVALLGEVLANADAIEPKAVEHAVEGARRLQILLGEYLVGHDLVTREALSWALEAQLLEKIAHLANMLPESTYAYYRDVDLLEGWGGGDITVSAPLNPILASVRNWMDRARIRATLNRIGKHSLVLHSDAELGTLAILPEEQGVLDVIRHENVPLPQLFKRGIADEEVVSSLVYALAVTRQFAFKGQKKGPMAARGGTQWKAAAPPSGSPTASGPHPSPGEGNADARLHTPHAPSASGPRRSVAAATPRAAAVGAMPPDPPPRSMPSPAASPPVSVRKAPTVQGASGAVPSGPASVGSGRPMAPAVRGSGSSGALPRVSPPQIRPIAAKKATIMGMQPAIPSNTRGPSSPAEDVGTSDLAASTAPGSPASILPMHTPPDGLKTTVMASPSLRRPGAAIGPAKAPVPLPSKAAAKAGGSGSRSSSPAAPNGEFGPPAGERDSIGEIDVDLDDVSPPARGMAELGEEGAADALAAMTHFRLAEAALQRNDTAGAEVLAEKAVSGDPGQVDYVSLLAWIRALAGSPAMMDEAIGVMSNVLAGDPANERALLYRGKLFVRTSRFEEALGDFHELLAANPHNREAATEVRLLKQRKG